MTATSEIKDNLAELAKAQFRLRRFMDWTSVPFHNIQNVLRIEEEEKREAAAISKPKINKPKMARIRNHPRSAASLLPARPAPSRPRLPRNRRTVPSIGFKTLVAEALSDKAELLLQDYKNAIHELLSPDVYPVEVIHALTRAERQGRITPAQGGKLYVSFMTSLPKLHPYMSLLPRAYDISSNMRVGVYDCPLPWQSARNANSPPQTTSLSRLQKCHPRTPVSGRISGGSNPCLDQSRTARPNHTRPGRKTLRQLHDQPAKASSLYVPSSPGL